MARRVDLAAVQAEIEDAIEMLCMTESPRGLVGSSKLAIATILHRNGLGRSKVTVRLDGVSLDVNVQFPPSIPEVLHVRVRTSR
jgi:hypothetical protein